MVTSGEEKKTVLVTGGCGKIGAYFTRSMSSRYAIRVADRVPWDAEKYGPPAGECITADLADGESCRRACAGMDMVVHLAADASPEADFLGSLLDNNILATYNIFQAALEVGCRRIVYASSIHAVAAYPRDVQINASMGVRPTTLYGVSKCFGEALAAHYAHNEGLPAVAIRIGAYLFPDELDLLLPHERDAYLHPDDFNQLLALCLDAPELPFFIAAGISDNTYKRIDLSETRHILGYHPQANIFEMLRW